MNRRSLVMVFPSVLVASCANKTPKPPLKPNALQSIAMLPIKEWPDSGAQFNQVLNPIQKDQDAPPPISPMLLGLAIGAAIRNSRNSGPLANAIAWVKFEPEPTLRKALNIHFSRRSVAIDAIADVALADRIRKRSPSDLPTTVDMVLDVQIYSAGYYNIGKNLGYTPSFKLAAKLLDTANPGEIVDEFSYSAEYSDSEGDSRFFTTPKSLTQSSLADFQMHPHAIRSGLSEVFDQIATKIVDDVLRVRAKLPHLD